MKIKHFLRLIIFSFFCLNSAQVFAAAVPAEQAKSWSEEKGRELINTLAERELEKKYENLDNLFINHVDLDHIGRFVVGKYWNTMTNDQKSQYIPLFKRYSTALYKTFPLNFEKDAVDFEVNRATVEKTYTLVYVDITLKKSATNAKEDFHVTVEFRLHEKDDKIMLTDLKIAEVSFIVSYRSRFYQMIEQNDGDINWFLEDLETITDSIEKTNEKNLYM